MKNEADWVSSKCEVRSLTEVTVKFLLKCVVSGRKKKQRSFKSLIKVLVRRICREMAGHAQSYHHKADWVLGCLDNEYDASPDLEKLSSRSLAMLMHVL